MLADNCTTSLADLNSVYAHHFKLANDLLYSALLLDISVTAKGCSIGDLVETLSKFSAGYSYIEEVKNSKLTSLRSKVIEKLCAKHRFVNSSGAISHHLISGFRLGFMIAHCYDQRLAFRKSLVFAQEMLV